MSKRIQYTHEQLVNLVDKLRCWLCGSTSPVPRFIRRYPDESAGATGEWDPHRHIGHNSECGFRERAMFSFPAASFRLEECKLKLNDSTTRRERVRQNQLGSQQFNKSGFVSMLTMALDAPRAQLVTKKTPKIKACILVVVQTFYERRSWEIARHRKEWVLLRCNLLHPLFAARDLLPHYALPLFVRFGGENISTSTDTGHQRMKRI